jgi:caspase domain-containing protein
LWGSQVPPRGRNALFFKLVDSIEYSSLTQVELIFAMASSSAKWAVLVGIDFYVPVKLRLQGAVNDIEDISALLKQDFAPINITKYVAVDSGDLNQRVPQGPKQLWPTHENVMRQLDHIIQSGSPGDHVFFHYSGHGTLRPTANKNYRLSSRSDAALVFFDEAGVDGARYLHGIELAFKFNQMIAKQLKLTVVLDCCHSGGVSRGKYRFRGIPWNDSISSAYPFTMAEMESNTIVEEIPCRDGRTKQFWLLSPEGYSVMAACGPDELAGECSGSDGKIHGTLSYQFTSALGSASKMGKDIDIMHIYRRICAKMHVSTPNQHPILLGHSMTSFMGDETSQTTTTAFCEVIKVSSDGTLLLNVGYAHGVSKGDEYMLQPEPPSRNSATSIPTSVRIVIASVTALHSKAEIAQKIAEKSPHTTIPKVKRGWFGTLLKPFRPKARVQLFAAAGEEWFNKIHDSSWLQILGADEPEISLQTFIVDATDQNQCVILMNGYTCLPYLPLMALEDRNTVGRVVSALEHMAKYANIERLENQSVSSTLESRAFSMEITVTDDPTTKMEGNVIQVKDGAEVEFTFSNHIDQTLYYTILNLTPLKRVFNLYPGDRDYFSVPPKGPHFHGDDSFQIEMKIPKSLQDDAESQSDDVLKLFISTEPTSFNMLELPALSEVVQSPNRGEPKALLSFLESLESDGLISQDSGGSRGKEVRKWTCRNYIVRTFPSLQHQRLIPHSEVV